MIKLQDSSKQTLHLLTQVKDYYIESELSTAEKLIHFTMLKSDKAYVDLKQENYLQTEDHRFVIKEINYSDRDYAEVFGKLDVDDLRATLIPSYESVQRNIEFVLSDVLVGTGWTHQLYDIPNKLRTIRADNKNAHEIIMDAMNTYGFEVEFDTLQRVVKVHQVLGDDRGAYVHSDLNLKKLEYQSDTYDFKTRLYAYGKDGLTFASINGGKEYVENHSFSNKIRETFWSDDRYTDAPSLLADAQAKLDQVAKPRLSYKVDIFQLTSLNPIYSILDYRLGDSVKIIEKENELIDNQRIVKLTNYPITPEKNSVELANSKIVFQSNEEEIKEVAMGEIIKVRTELMEEIERTNALIGGGSKGFIIIRVDENGDAYEQLIMDTNDVATATKVWRWNVNGLGYSSTGYNGSYRLAITSDGKINADFITVGTLSAQLIKTGLLKSANNQTWIDMDTGYFSFGGKINYNAQGVQILLASGKTVEEGIQDAQDYADVAVGEKADTSDLNTLSETVGNLSGEIQAKADMGELEALEADYLRRQEAQAAEKLAAEAALSEIEGRVTEIFEDLGEAKKVTNYVKTTIHESNNGIFVGEIDGQLGILISPRKISFLANGVEAASISGTTMEITNGIFTKTAEIGKHKIETIANGVTVFTYIG